MEIEVVEIDLTVKVYWFWEAASHVVVQGEQGKVGWYYIGQEQDESKRDYVPFSYMEITEFLICFRAHLHLLRCPAKDNKDGAYAGDRRSTQYTSPHNCSMFEPQDKKRVYNLVIISASPNWSRLIRPGSTILGPASSWVVPCHGSRTAGVGAFGTYTRAFVFCQGFPIDPCAEARCFCKFNLNILVHGCPDHSTHRLAFLRIR